MSRRKIKLARDQWWKSPERKEAAARKHAGTPGLNDWEQRWALTIEPAAFRYEVLRRNGFEELPPWPDLPDNLLPFVVGTLQGELTKATWRLYPIDPAPGWATMDARAWNLHASDAALCRSFMAFINGNRALQGLMQTPKRGKKSRNLGRRNRSVSWRVVEAMDEKDAGATLNDSDRGNVSHAKRSVAPYVDRLRSAIQAAKGFAQAENIKPGLIHSSCDDAEAPLNDGDDKRTSAKRTNSNDRRPS